MNYKKLISISEGCIYVLLLIFTMLAIFDIISAEFTNIFHIFNLLSLRLSLILFVLFIFLPYLLIYFRKLGDKALVKYNQQKLKSQFFNEVKETKTIDILSLSKKYDVNLLYVKNFLRDQITQGLLKGELKKDVFHVKKDFKIMDVKEKRIKFMYENIGKFIAPHRSIKIKEISNNFKVPKEIVVGYLKKLINQDILRGYIEESDIFIRDLSIPKDIICPNCKEKIKL